MDATRYAVLPAFAATIATPSFPCMQHRQTAKRWICGRKAETERSVIADAMLV